MKGGYETALASGYSNGPGLINLRTVGTKPLVSIARGRQIHRERFVRLGLQDDIPATGMREAIRGATAVAIELMCRSEVLIVSSPWS